MRDPSVYFLRPIGQRGPIKIGCSMSPRTRLSALMVWSPVELEIVATIPGDFDLERRIHGAFLTSLIRHEWFANTPELDALVEGILAGRAIGDLIDLRAPVIKRKRPKNLTPSQRLRSSYTHRLRWACKREEVRNRTSEDVDEVMSRWSSYHPGGPIHPTVSELERLEEVLRQPHVHFLTYAEKYPEHDTPARPKRRRQDAPGSREAA